MKKILLSIALLNACNMNSATTSTQDRGENKKIKRQKPVKNTAQTKNEKNNNSVSVPFSWKKDTIQIDSIKIINKKNSDQKTQNKNPKAIRVKASYNNTPVGFGKMGLNDTTCTLYSINDKSKKASEKTALLTIAIAIGDKKSGKDLQEALSTKPDPKTISITEVASNTKSSNNLDSIKDNNDKKMIHKTTGR